MVGGVAYAISPPKVPKVQLGAVAQDGSVRTRSSDSGAGKSRAAGKASKAGRRANGGAQSFMRRLEGRWDRRRQDGP